MTDIQLFFLWASCMMFLLFLYTAGNYVSSRNHSKYTTLPKFGLIEGGLNRASLGWGINRNDDKEK